MESYKGALDNFSLTPPDFFTEKPFQYSSKKDADRHCNILLSSAKTGNWCAL